ncbi:MAG: SPOR domain-containing protein [Alphaproteobacteria bacterium]
MMAFKRPLFRGGLHAGLEDRDPLGDRQPANQSDPREGGAQRGTSYPGDPDFEVDLLDDDGGRRPGGWRSSIAIGAALAVFVGVLWYAYGWGIEQLARTRLPMIVADTAPIKSRPASPGGIEVLHQDVAVLNDAASDPGKPQAERLLPPPEAPRMAQTEATRVEAPQAEGLPATSAIEVENLLGPPLETAAGPPGQIPAAEETQPTAVPSAAPQIAVVRLPDAVPEPVLPEPEPETRLALEPPVVPTMPPTVATSEPAPRVAALPEAKTGGFVVQLAALKAKDSARPAWARLQKAHPALLGDRDLAIQRVDLGDRGIFYRVQAGFFVERTGARDLCNALKARGQDCLVVKR